jgi:hypothetical protein
MDQKTLDAAFDILTGGNSAPAKEANASASTDGTPGTGISISVLPDGDGIKTEVREIPITDEEREQWAREEEERKQKMRDYYDSLPPEIKERLFVTPDICDGIMDLRRYVKIVCDELKVPVPKMKRKAK